MRFGIYAEMQTAPGKNHAEMTWEILRQIEHADAAGFDCYSVIDHHFFPKFSVTRSRPMPHTIKRQTWPGESANRR